MRTDEARGGPTGRGPQQAKSSAHATRTAPAAAAKAAGDATELLVGDGDGHFAPIDPQHELWGTTRQRLLDALG